MSLLETAIEWVAPPTCLGCGAEGSSLCLPCQMAEIVPFGEKCFNCHRLSAASQTCPACRRRLPLSHVWVATEYDGLAKELITKFKFNHQRRAALVLAAVMTPTLLTFNSDELLASMDYLIVPIPTASNRIRQRGFDHTQVLAKEIARRLKLKPASPLARQNQTKQVGSSRKVRVQQTAGSYRIKRPETVKNRNILLIDDVVTTGATIGEVAKLLRKAGARQVDALIFAKSL